MYLILLHVLLFTGVCSVNSISTCPEGCRCSIVGSVAQVRVVCGDISSGTLLTRIPELPADTLQLVVYDQNIERIYKEDFTVENVPSLDILILENNTIRLVDDGAFEELEALTLLVLNENLISVINESTFSNLQLLGGLNLDANNIEIIADGAFKDLGNLISLYLGANSISVINESTFRGLHMLENLRLSRNNIAAIDAAAFKDLRNLHFLDLRENSITVVPEGAFSELRNLYIKLESNPLWCDCRMQWIIGYISEGLSRTVLGTCQLPANLDGTEIRSLSDENMADCQFTTDTPIVTSMTTDEQLSTAHNPSSSVSLMERSSLNTASQPSPSFTPEQPTISRSTIDTPKQPSSSFSPEQPTIPLNTFDSSKQLSSSVSPEHPTSSSSSEQATRSPSTVGTYYIGLVTAFFFGGAVVAILMTLCLHMEGIRKKQRQEDQDSSGGERNLQMSEHSNQAFEMCIR